MVGDPELRVFESTEEIVVNFVDGFAITKWLLVWVVDYNSRMLQ